jgi:penicillin-binding protein 2
VKLIPTEREATPAPERPILRDDPKFASAKIAVLQYLLVAVFVLLIARFWQLQVMNPDVYTARAERNRIRALPILAPRGKILDRDGRVIVDNQASYTLFLSRENLRPEHLDTICEGLSLDCQELKARLARFDKSRPRYEPIMLRQELTPAELAFVEAHRGQDLFPEMELIPYQRRLYPGGGVAAHVLGYIGEVSEEELNTAEFARYRQGDFVGKAGVERQYNDVLMGVDGQRRVVVDNRGRHRQTIDMKEASPGKTIRLSIDLDLQVVAELAMENRRGAVVALDPRNGEVLAMVSRPSYDPNKFAGRIRGSDWRELVHNPENPLLNRSIQAQLAPGSTFKPIVALAGLESGLIDDNFGVSCGGGAVFYNRFFKCHARHGGVALHRGLVQSCDVYFYNVGNRVGVDRIAEYSEMAGLGRKTGIDLPHEAAGLVPSTRWKIRQFRQKWYAGETISVAIGQGALTVTPVQLAHAIGGLAMGGVWHKPHLMRDQVPPEPARKADLNMDNVAKVIYGLYGVVNEGGTGVRARIPGVEVCGKTGSAQLVSNEFNQARREHERLKDNAWFVGFAPREAPEIVVVALFEEGEHGNLAAPIVRDVIKAHFDKKARLAPLPPSLARAARKEAAP